MRAELMELIGTFFLVLIIAMTGDPLSIGVGLMALVYIGGHISGAHYNPAVTLAIWMRGALPAAKLIPYWIAQLVGGFLAAATAYAAAGIGFIAAPKGGIPIWQPALVEVLFTFVLASVILIVATSKQFKNNHIYGVAIGFTLFACAAAGAGISGAAYNPAVGIAPALFQIVIGGSASVLNMGIYLVGPLIGGAVAALLFRYFNPKEIGKKS